MTAAKMFLASDKLVLDVVWFFLLCAMIAFLRFHKWGGKTQAHAKNHADTASHKTRAA